MPSPLARCTAWLHRSLAGEWAVLHRRSRAPPEEQRATGLPGVDGTSASFYANANSGATRPERYDGLGRARCAGIEASSSPPRRSQPASRSTGGARFQGGSVFPGAIFVTSRATGLQKLQKRYQSMTRTVLSLHGVEAATFESIARMSFGMQHNLDRHDRGRSCLGTRIAM